MLYLVVCCSYYYSNILFPHHLPKIRNSVLHGALSRNVMIRSSAHVQLQWNHSAQMQFNARQKAMQDRKQCRSALSYKWGPVQASYFLVSQLQYITILKWRGGLRGLHLACVASVSVGWNSKPFLIRQNFFFFLIHFYFNKVLKTT